MPIKHNNNTPVIMLTAMGESENRIEGLKFGADDYLPNPFEPEELFLRINTILRRYENSRLDSKIVTFGEYKFDLKKLILKRNDENIYLTEGEKNLIYILAKKVNNTVTREALAQGDVKESDLRKVDVQITRLRQKIEKNPKKPSFIQTIRGRGYRLIAN